MAGGSQKVFVVEGETLRIDCSGSIDSGNHVRTHETWWYAPALAAVVHYEIECLDRPSVGHFSYDLKRIKIPAGAKIARAAPDRTGTA